MTGPGGSVPDVNTNSVGLSPTYWAHVPLSISQIKALQLINGVNCLRIPKTDTSGVFFTQVSRCRVIGCIVSMKQKYDDVIHYVLDDGTGLLDCIAWPDGSNGELPKLVGDGDCSELDACRVGDMVEIMGRIETFAMSGSTAAVARELHIANIQTLSSCPSRRAVPQCLDTESRHMISIANAKFVTDKDALDWLGPVISQQVDERLDFPAADDTSGAWRLFGTRCPCGDETTNSIKRELLYCHCLATPEQDFDPDLLFRDYLLSMLLNREAEAQRNVEAIANVSGSEVRPLFISYRDLRNDDEIRAIAMDHLLMASVPVQNPTDEMADQLLLRTVRALRKDAILHLYDNETDVYLLISRKAVLEPYLRILHSNAWEDSVARMKLKRQRPSFLDNVPKARLHYVKRNSTGATNHSLL